MRDLEWLALLGSTLGVVIETSAGRMHDRLHAERPGLRSPGWVALGQRAGLADRVAAGEAPIAAEPGAAEADAPSGRFRVVAGRPLVSGAAAERTPGLAHQRAPWVDARAVRCRAARPRRGRGGDASSTPPAPTRGPLRISPRLRPGVVRDQLVRRRASRGDGTVVVG